MIKKECCQNCWGMTDIGWIALDEERWSVEEIWCPSERLIAGEPIIRNIIGKPPKNCPYYLENIL